MRKLKSSSFSGCSAGSSPVVAGLPRSLPWEALLEDFGDRDRPFHPLIKKETEFGRVADIDPLGDFRLQEPAATCRPRRSDFAGFHRPSPRREPLHTADRATPRRNVTVTSRTRGSLSREDRHADDFADGCGGFFSAAGGMVAVVSGQLLVVSGLAAGDRPSKLTAYHWPLLKRPGNFLDLVASSTSPSLMSLYPASLMPHSKPSRTSRASSFSRFSDSMG